jgi:hypothetical protein
LLFSLGLDPPSRLTPRVGQPSRRPLGIAAATAILVFGMFFDSVHLGHQIKDREAGSFTSIFTAPELLAQAEDRAVRWRADPPIDRTRMAREDQYRTEGIQHVRRRNEAWAAGDVNAAWRENRILETYYEPVLETGHRWAAEHRADAAHRFASLSAADAKTSAPYMSAAYPYAIYTWPASGFWFVIMTVSALALLASFGLGQRR